jgi:predicted nucleotidyltransferase
MNKVIQKWIYVAMRFHEVLDDILGTKTKVRLLRAFFTYPGKEFSESELQRIAGIPQASGHRNLRALLDHGLLSRRRIGKANLYSMNKRHVLHSSLERLFEDEKNLINTLKETIRENLQGMRGIELAVLFGSIVKARERPDSDVDILIVSDEDKTVVEEGLRGLVSALEEGFGNPVSLMIKSREELDELRGKAIYDEIKTGEVLLRRRGFRW